MILNATLMLGVGAVTMTPDTPLVFFVTLALWALVRVERDGLWWLLVGVAMGLALDSKYTAVLIAAGIPLWLAWVPRLRGDSAGRGFTQAACSRCCCLRRWWRGTRSMAGRASRGRAVAPAIGIHRRRGRYVGELLLSQLGLITPLLFALFAAGLFAWPRRRGRRDPGWTLLAAVVVPGLVVFLQHALGDRVQANWVAVLYPPLAIAAAACGIRWWRAAAGLGFALTALVYLQGAAAPFPLPRRLDPTLIRLGGWDRLAQQADALRSANGLGYLALRSMGSPRCLRGGCLPGRGSSGRNKGGSCSTCRRVRPGQGCC